MEPDKLISEARARIIWGDSSLSVHEFLITNGISATVADAKIKEFVHERNLELRRIGIKNILIGAVLIGAAGLTIYLTIPSTSIFGRMLGLVLLPGLYGLWKLMKGIIYLVLPQSEHKSIPDIVGSDILE